MKKLISLILAAALVLCLLAGCAAKKPLAPSLFAERYEASRAEISQLTRDEIWELCEDKAVGTVVSVTRVERDYFPVLINLAHDVNAYRAVPIEQWEADHWVVTVKLDEVLEGRTFTYPSFGGYVTLDMPVEFSELEYWDEKAPRYTGRKLAVASPGDAVPQVGDRVTLLLGSHCAGVLLDDTMLNTWGMSPGKRDGSYSYADVCRRNVVEPRKEGETFLEAAFVGPMLSRSALSPEQAEARSAFAVRGTIKNAKLIQGPLYADYMQQPSWEDPLETWDGEIWRVYVSIDEALKQDGEPLEAGDELVLYVPKTLTNAASGKELTFDGVAPAEGAEITVRWNEGGAEPVAVDFTARTADGAIDVLFGFVDRDPPGPDGLIRID